MGNFFKKKIELADVFLYTLALYPLLKFNISSVILFIFITLIAFNAYKNKQLDVSKKQIFKFTFLSLYIIIVFLSLFYSENKEDALKRITRFIPLLVVPALLIFCNTGICEDKKNKALHVFLIANILYVFSLFGVYKWYVFDSGISNLSFSKLLSNQNEFQLILDQLLGEDILSIHKAYFSMGFVICAIFSLSHFFKKLNKNKALSGLYLTTFFFFFFLILNAFSFPNVIALFLSIGVLLIFGIKNRLIKKKYSLIISSVVIMCVAGGVYIKSEDLDVKRGLNFIESIVKNSDVESNDPRIEIYTTAKSLYKQASISDILFGYGIGDVQDKLSNEYSIRLKKANDKNNLFFSEEFNDGYWFKHNIEIVPNKKLAPNGSYSSDVLKEQPTKIQSSHNISSEITTQLQPYTFSIYAKKGSANHIILRLGEIDQRATFNLEEGTYNLANNTSVKATINKLNSSDWYRCSITTKIEGKALIIIGLSNSKNEYNYRENKNELYIWGAQLEKGELLTPYVKNNNALLKYASERNLNTHNNYLYFLFAGGVFCLLTFLFTIGVLFKISIKNMNVFQLTFCIIIAINLLTENILSRHWGLVFVSFMLITLFTNNQNAIDSKT